MLVAITTTDLLLFGWSIHPRQALSVLALPDPTVDAVHQILLKAGTMAGPVRVLGSPAVAEVAPDRLVPFGMQDAGGYSSLDMCQQRAFLQRVQRVDDDLLDLCNVRYVLDPATYGALNEYQGVQYFPRNPLLDATLGGDLSDEVLRVSSSVAPTEIRVVSALIGGADLAQNTGVAEITLHAASGDVVGRVRLRAGVDTMDWAWDDEAGAASAQHLRVEVAGEFADKLADGRVASRVPSFARIQLRSTTGAADTVELRSIAPRGRLVVYGVALVDRDGNLQQLFGRNKSKYREIAHDQKVRVLENTAAYPRAFLVPRARMAPPDMSLEKRESRPFSPHEEVVLAAETPPTSLNPAGIDAAALSKPGVRGTARVDWYTPAEVDLSVDTPMPAFLVVTDTFYPGWHAYLDQRESPILRGDLIFRVVEVPAGVHQIVFRFEPASVWAGLAISLGCSRAVAGCPGRGEAQAVRSISASLMQVVRLLGLWAILDGMFLAVMPRRWARWWSQWIGIIGKRPPLARAIVFLEWAVGVWLVMYSGSRLRRNKDRVSPARSESARHTDQALFSAPASLFLLVLFRAPIWLYRLRLGWTLGNRFLLLTHRGRKSGSIYRTVIEVVHYNPETRESVVVSGWGSRAEWYRNIQHSPPLEVDTGGKRYKPVFRELRPEEKYPVVVDYMRRVPRLARPIVRRLGFDTRGPEAERRAHAERLLMIGFRPAAGLSS